MRSASWAVTLRSRGASATSPRVTWLNAQDLSCLLGAGSPLGGVRPKSAVGLADERLAIAKFPKPDDTRDIAAGEILALTQTKGSPPAVFDKSGQLWILGCLQDFPRKKIAPIKGHFPGDPFGGFGGSPLQQESDDVQPGSRIDLVFPVAREQVP